MTRNNCVGEALAKIYHIVNYGPMDVPGKLLLGC